MSRKAKRMKKEQAQFDKRVDKLHRQITRIVAFTGVETEERRKIAYLHDDNRERLQDIAQMMDGAADILLKSIKMFSGADPEDSEGASAIDETFNNADQYQMMGSTQRIIRPPSTAGVCDIDELSACLNAVPAPACISSGKCGCNTGEIRPQSGDPLRERSESQHLLDAVP